MSDSLLIGLGWLYAKCEEKEYKNDLELLYYFMLTEHGLIG